MMVLGYGISTAQVAVITPQAKVTNPRLISVHFNQKLLPKALKAIAQKANIGISFKTVEVPNDLVTYQTKDASVNHVLDAVLEGTDLYYTLSDNQKVIFVKQKFSRMTVQQNTVSGTVIDAQDGSPLPGVNILVVGTSTGTTTDANGHYELQVETLQDTLRFSFIGYQTQRIAIHGRPNIDVHLSPTTHSLKQMVVIGFGKQKQETITSAISSVDSSAIQDQPSASANQLIQGKIAGATVSASNGMPGAGINIEIRGPNSLSGSTQPLYVVDGVPIQNSGTSVPFGDVTTSPIAFLDPDNIASIEILKDAAATAIYGARASNGVVLITTKHGMRSAAPTIKVSSYFGFEKASKLPDLVDGQTYEMLQNEAAKNNGLPAPYPDPESAINTNWVNKVFRTGMVRKNGISISGGNKTLTYSISGANYKQDADVRPSYFKRSGIKVNLTVHATDKFKIGTNTKFSRIHRNRRRAGDSPRGLLAGVYFYPSNLPVKNKDGSFTKFSIMENPVVSINHVHIGLNSNRFLGDVFAEYDFTPDLSLNSRWGFDYDAHNHNSYNDTKTIQGGAVNGEARYEKGHWQQWNGNINLKYGFNVGESNDFNLLIGGSIEEHKFVRTVATGTQFPNNSFRRLGSASVLDAFGGASSNRLASIFGRLRFNHNSKYLVTLSFRRDGSSRFGTKYRWGLFPSAAVGWILSNEPFLDGAEWLNNLKLRLSWGQTGNQSGIGNFQSMALWTGTSYAALPGMAPTQLANPDLKWETSTQYDVGFDMSIFSQRLQISYDYYYKKTTDLLLNVPIPETTGFTSLAENFGALQNQGMEFSLKSSIFKQQNFQWDLNFNISGYRNKVLKLAAPFDVYNRDVFRYQEGYPMYSFYMHVQTGVNPKTGAIEFKDVNGDGKFTASGDRTIVGNANPSFHGGINNTFQIKNWTVTVNFDYTYGNKELYWAEFFQQHGGTREANFLKSQLKRWTHPGQRTMVPKMVASNYAPNLRPSRFVKDGSYMRLQTFRIGYTLPKNVIGSHIKNVHVYLNAQNLFTFTSYPGLNPTMDSFGTTSLARGVDFYTMPLARIFTGGFTITF